MTYLGQDIHVEWNVRGSLLYELLHVHTECLLLECERVLCFDKISIIYRVTVAE